MNRDAALRLAEHGLCVFPCKVGKTPAPGFKWTEWATNDPSEVRAIWDHYGDCAPAIHLGRCGLVVLDFDKKGGKDGMTAFDTLGIDIAPQCPAAETPSLGFHTYFRQPVDRTLGNRTGALPAGIDVRGDGGYVLAPRAVLDTGEVYSDVPGWPELCAAFFADTIPTILDPIVDLIEAGKEPEPEAVGCPVGAVTVAPCTGAWDTARADAYIEVPLKDRADTLAGMPAESGRNHYLNQSVFHISGLIHCPTLANTSINMDEVWNAMSWGYAMHPSRKRNAAARFRKTFMSGWNDGARKPARGPAPDPLDDIVINLKRKEPSKAA